MSWTWRLALFLMALFACDKIKSFEVRLMIMKEMIHQLLWLFAFSMPIGIAGIMVHTPMSLWGGLLGFIFCGLIGPFFYYMMQKQGVGIRYGIYRSAIHAVAWPVFSVLAIMLCWGRLEGIQVLWSNKLLFIFLSILTMGVMVTLTAAVDYLLAHLYFYLKKKSEKVSQWLAMCYFIGLIPGTVILSMLVIYLMGKTRLDPFTALLFVTDVLEKAFLLKIGLAMITFATYLYLSLIGTKGKRITQVIFTALMYLILIYIPIVISLQIPGADSWRSYADPAYISGIPVLSDLWSVGTALFCGKKISDWIFT